MESDELPVAKTTVEVSAEADPHAGPRPDGHGPSAQPAGTEGDDHSGDRQEPSPRRGHGGSRPRRSLPKNCCRCWRPRRRPTPPTGRSRSTPGKPNFHSPDGERVYVAINGNLFPTPKEPPPSPPSKPEGRDRRDPPTEPAAADPFDEIDFGSFFDDYLDPGYKARPPNRSKNRPSKPSSPLPSPRRLSALQLAVVVIPDPVRDAAEAIIGNLDEDGYLTASLEEIAPHGEHQTETVEAALAAVQSLDPAASRARCAASVCCCRSPASTALAVSPGRSSPATCACSKPGNTKRWRAAGRPSITSKSPVYMIRHSIRGPACAIRSRRAGGRAGRNLHQGRRRLHHPDDDEECRSYA